MKHLAIIFLPWLLLGCASPSTNIAPPLPPAPPVALEQVESVQQPGASGPVCVIEWSASPTPGVSYQVWQTDNLLLPFTLAVVTTNLSWPVYSSAQAGFFMARAVNAYGLVSTWAKVK